MKSLADINLLEILPEPLLADEKIVAAAKALNLQLQQLSQDIKYALHLPRIDDLPHEVLDQLAWQYDCMFFEPTTMNLETKRQIIKNTILQHKTLGTRYAVEQMLSVFSSNAQVQEFFEYEGGKPYHFKIKMSGLRDLDDAGETILRLINLSKNERSWLDEFEFKLNDDWQDLHFGIIELYQGGNRPSDRLNGETAQKLHIKQTELFCGKQLYQPCYYNTRHETRLKIASASLQYGRVRCDCARDDIDSDSYKLWLQWLKWHWAQFSKNAVVKHYTRDGSDIFEDDIDEKILLDGNFLKLYFNFQDSSESRLIILPYPREDFTAADIKTVAAKDILLSRKKKLSLEIYRAVLVRKRVERWLF